MYHSLIILLHIINLGDVTDGHTALSLDEEVESASLSIDSSRNGGVVRVNRSNGGRVVLNVELTNTRSVDIRTELVLSRGIREVHEHDSRISRSLQVLPTILIGNVVAEEAAIGGSVEINGIHLDAQRTDVRRLLNHHR